MVADCWRKDRRWKVRDYTRKERINLTWSAEECKVDFCILSFTHSAVTPGRFERWRCGKEGPAVLSFFRIFVFVGSLIARVFAAAPVSVCFAFGLDVRKTSHSTRRPNAREPCRPMAGHYLKQPKAQSRKYAPVSDPPRPAHWPNTVRATDFLKLSPSRPLCCIPLGSHCLKQTSRLY